MKKPLRHILVASVLIILIAILAYSPDYKGQLIIVPDAIFFDQFQLYEKSNETVKYLPSKLDEYLIGPYAEDQMTRASNFMSDTSFTQYGDLIAALDERVRELGHSNVSEFRYVGLENYGSENSAEISYWPVTAILAKQEVSDSIAVIELNLAVVKERATGSYKVAAQYSREYDLVKGGIFSVDHSLPLDAFTFEKSESQNSHICFFTEREVSNSLGVADSISYYFQCLEPHEWAVLSGWKSAPLSTATGVLPVSECSLGSLWQQFACRYLGQSKYDEKGNLKPEARAELGLSE